MSSFRINLNNHCSWVCFNNTHVFGAAFDQTLLKQAESLHLQFAGADSADTFAAKVKKMNGFFAVVRERDNQVFAAVDRVRSMPLFYGVADGNFYLSDDARWVQEQVGDTARDPLAESEFLLAGYVTGPDTLYPRVKQLQAGEILIASAASDQIQLQTIRYYRYLHEDDLQADEEALLVHLDRVLVGCFERLVTCANGRMIVLPLSGGYDSRLIALMLKRLGYENLLAFSYGRPENLESQISQQVAHTLGIRWEFVPYSHEAWQQWFQSEQRYSYYRMADGLTALPHTQDWAAVWELKRQGKLPQDAVFVPGHTGDFISGGHVPISFGEAKNVGVPAFTEAVINKHYPLWDLLERGREFRAVLQERVVRLTEASNFDAPTEAASAFEKWEWQERQAKFIVNSVRVYDFWGYAWWLPLWDAELMDFWAKVPLKHRLEQRLYKKFVDQRYQLVTGVPHRAGSKSDSPNYLFTLRRVVTKSPLKALAATPYAYYKQLKKRSIYEGDPLALHGAVPWPLFKKLYTGREDINFLIASIYLNNEAAPAPTSFRKRRLPA